MTEPNPESYIPLTKQTVVRLDQPEAMNSLEIPNDLVMVERLASAIAKRITTAGKSYYSQLWAEQGMDGSVLIPGQDWQKGKIRIRVEFLPNIPPPPPEETPKTEEPEESSPLDDIRQALLQNDR